MKDQNAMSWSNGFLPTNAKCADRESKYKFITSVSSQTWKRAGGNDHAGSKLWPPVEERPWSFATFVIRLSTQDSQHDGGHRNEQTESCMHRKVHVQFGGGPMEQGTWCTSPAAYPTPHVERTPRGNARWHQQCL